MRCSDVNWELGECTKNKQKYILYWFRNCKQASFGSGKFIKRENTTVQDSTAANAPVTFKKLAGPIKFFADPDPSVSKKIWNQILNPHPYSEALHALHTK